MTRQTELLRPRGLKLWPLYIFPVFLSPLYIQGGWRRKVVPPCWHPRPCRAEPSPGFLTNALIFLGSSKGSHPLGLSSALSSDVTPSSLPCTFSYLKKIFLCLFIFERETERDRA